MTLRLPSPKAGGKSYSVFRYDSAAGIDYATAPDILMEQFEAVMASEGNFAFRAFGTGFVARQTGATTTGRTRMYIRKVLLPRSGPIQLNVNSAAIEAFVVEMAGDQTGAYLAEYMEDVARRGRTHQMLDADFYKRRGIPANVTFPTNIYEKFIARGVADPKITPMAEGILSVQTRSA